MTAGAPLRLAVIGGGAIGGAHAEAITSAPDAELAAIIDPSAEARERAARTWSCPTFPATATALGELRFDAACICAPPHRHRDIAQSLLDAGVHVLCEKPLAIHAADARMMVEAARAAGRVLVVSSKFRYVDELAEAQRRIAAGALGRPVFGEVTFCARVPVAGDWKSDPSIAGGGVVMDNGSHVYDVLSVVLGTPLEPVAATFGPPVVQPDVEDTAEIHVRAPGGVLARVALSWTYFTKDLDYLMVQGSEGGLKVGWRGGAFRRHGGSEWEPFGMAYDKRSTFARMIAAFLTRVRSGSAGDAESGVGAVEFIERVYALAGVDASDLSAH